MEEGHGGRWLLQESGWELVTTWTKSKGMETEERMDQEPIGR